MRPLKDEDVELIRQWRNNHRDSFFDASEITKEMQRAWYQRYKETDGKDQMFIMCLKDGTAIGQVAIYNINVADRNADFGRFLLLEEYRGHGYAEECVKGMMEYCFETLRLYKVKIQVHLDNIDAIAIYARSGFKTTTRPILYMERVNPNYDWKKPITIAGEKE